MPKVSVIIPVYGVEPFIERCARSLFEQTLEDMEFIFVDDCSPDRSVEILNKVVSEYPNRNVSVWKQSINCGVSAVPELALSKATGEYLGFCDSDDWVDPNMYKTLVETAEAQDADVVGCGFWEHSIAGITERTFLHRNDSREVILSPFFFGGIYGALWNKLIKKDFFDSASQDLWKGISMWEDSCMLIPLRLQSSKTVFLDDCLYHYNVNANSITTKFSMKKVNDAIVATRRLEHYFYTEGLLNDASALINYLKIASKEVLLRFPKKENVEMWKNVFPEAKRYIMHYHPWNFILKIRAMLVSFLPSIVGVQLLKLKKSTK